MKKKLIFINEMNQYSLTTQIDLPVTDESFNKLCDTYFDMYNKIYLFEDVTEKKRSDC